MRDKSINDKILNILKFAQRALTAGEIRRRLTVEIESSDLSSRLTILMDRKDVVATRIPRPAEIITGPKEVNAYSLVNGPEQIALPVIDNGSHQLNIFNVSPQT
jgi:hypothetical protein